MTPPLLKLAFVQGPKDGQSVEFKPGSTIRIGRVVRGNEIAIKDAGISTKHLRIISDSENWILDDLGSSNGTILNTLTLEPDRPFILRHGDTVKIGEKTSFVVNFVSDVPLQEDTNKLPPRPTRNTKRQVNPDPEPVQEKPKRRGRPPKQKKVSNDEPEPSENTVEELEENARITRSQKKDILITKSIKLEVEDNTPKGVEIPVIKRSTRGKKIEDASVGLLDIKSEDLALEEKCNQRVSRSTRSRKGEIGGDSFLELDMVLKQSRKGRAKKKETDKKLAKSVVETEAKSGDVETGKDNQAQEDCSDKAEQKEVQLKKSPLGEERNLKSTAVEDGGEIENLQDIIDQGKGCETEDADTLEEKDDKRVIEEMEANDDVNDNEGSDDKEDEREIVDGSKRTEEEEEVELRKSKIGEDDLNSTVRGGETENLEGTSEEQRDCTMEEVGIETLDDRCGGEKLERAFSDMKVEVKDSKAPEEIESRRKKSILREEDDLNSTGTENLEDAIDEERGCKTNDAGIEASGGKKVSSKKKAKRVAEKGEEKGKKVDLAKMSLGDWFDHMELQLVKQINEETEKLIEPMRSKAQRVHNYIIAEQKKQQQAKGKGKATNT